jgi:fumarate reductase subunit C
MSERRPYRRPVDHKWWWKPGAYRAYTLRELTGVAVAIYGAVLFVGLISLSRGPDSWNGFLHFLRSPFSVALHFVLLAAVAYHLKTWFEILPKTQPKIIVEGKLVPPQTITKYATLVALACSAFLILLARWVA